MSFREQWTKGSGINQCKETVLLKSLHSELSPNMKKIDSFWDPVQFNNTPNNQQELTEHAQKGGHKLNTS